MVLQERKSPAGTPPTPSHAPLLSRPGAAQAVQLIQVQRVPPGRGAAPVQAVGWGTASQAVPLGADPTASSRQHPRAWRTASRGPGLGTAGRRRRRAQAAAAPLWAPWQAPVQAIPGRRLPHPRPPRGGCARRRRGYQTGRGTAPRRQGGLWPRRGAGPFGATESTAASSQTRRREVSASERPPGRAPRGPGCTCAERIGGATAGRKKNLVLPHTRTMR